MNGEYALEIIKEKYLDKDCDCYYSLIFLDCNMPVMDGFEACTRLLEMQKNKEIPHTAIIAYTADLTNRNLDKC